MDFGGAKNEGMEFYSIYSVRGVLEETLIFWAICNCQNASPWPPLIFTFNLSGDSQAGYAGSSPVSRSIKSITYSRAERK
jgi:hypothetical protein